MIVTWLILQMGITTPRQVSRHVQLKTNATVASNLPPQMNLRHMRNNMLDRHGYVLSVIKSQMHSLQALQDPAQKEAPAPVHF